MQSRPIGLADRVPVNQTSINRRHGQTPRILRKFITVFRNIYFQGALVLLAALHFYQYFTANESHVRDRTVALAHTVGDHLPSFLGLWDIKKPQGSFSPLFPTSEEITMEAKQILPIVNQLMEKKFFRIFKVDLDKECPFWARKDLCSSPAASCSVCECSEEQIPQPWKERPVEHFVDRKFYEQEEVSPWVRHTPFTGLPGPAGEAEDNFLAALSGTDHGGRSTYVDLSLNPPCFTNFKGQNVWSLIYKENCLHKEEDDEERSIVLDTGDKQCSEEDFFVKMISGLQTAIMVLSSEYNKPLERGWPIPLSAPSRTLKTKGAYERSPPRHWYSLDLFRRRVAWNREWMENMYIDFSLLVRTVMKVRGVIESCNCYTGTEIEDQQSRSDMEKLIHLISKLPSAEPARLEQPLFKRKHELALRQFTNISRILDCVECEKCRLHGKVKITALQVALKGAGPSMSSDGLTPLVISSLERNEITGLINTLGYFADAVLIIDRFERRIRTIRALLAFIVAIPLLFFGSYIMKTTQLLEKSGITHNGLVTKTKAANTGDLAPLLCMLDETTSTTISSSNSATTTNGNVDEFKVTALNKNKNKRRKR